MPLLRRARHAGQGFAPDRGRVLDPPPAHLPGLRRPLHHLRARAVARADGGQEERPPRAVRPRQAAALGRSRAAQARRRRRTGRAHDQRHRAAVGEPGRRRHSDRAHRRTGDGGAQGPRRRRLRALRLGLSQFPRSARLQRDRRRIGGRARADVAGESRAAANARSPADERAAGAAGREDERWMAAALRSDGAAWASPRPTLRSAR